VRLRRGHRLGQFLSEDPIGFTARDPNLRRYVGNEPTRYTDPSGNARQPLFYLEIDPATRRVRKVYGRRPSLRESMNAAMAEPDAEAPADPIYVGGQPVTPPLSMQIRRAGGVGPYLCAEAGKPGVLDNVQRGLQAIGMVDQGIFGAIADLVNAGIDLLRGDVAGAGLGVLAAFPLVGNFFGGANSARKAADGLQDAAAVADKARDAQKAAGAAAETKKCVASSSGVATGPAHNAANYARLREFCRQAEQYGQGGYRVLENGRYRFYGELTPARTAGEMQGARLVREWDPVTGNTRTWYETLDHLGRVRSVAPKPPTGPLNHRIFDADGNYQGLR
jgi:hypothetical protein